MSENLLRQRRNLFVTCVLLWVMKYGGVKFTKFSLAGFDVHFDHPEALILCVWIAYGYFLYRYYQYFSGEGVDKLRSVFSAAMEKYCEPIIKAIVKNKHPHSNDATLYSFALLRMNKWVYRGQDLVPEQDGSIRSAEPFVFLVHKRSLAGPTFRAVSDSVLRNSVVTDYLLPFILAAFILYYCGSANWPGSLFSFILPDK